MTGRDDTAAFAFAEHAAKEQKQPQQVPERIRKHAPTPALRPDGSWRARADAVDQAVREARDAAKAKNEWAARLKTGVRRAQGKGLGRSKHHG